MNSAGRESARGVPRNTKVVAFTRQRVLSRRVGPEQLDVLPTIDPRAQHSRRDLIKLNWIMGHERLMLRMMRGEQFDTLIDLGTGDGRFAARLARGLKHPFHLILVDQQRVPGAPSDVVVSDARSFVRGLGASPRTALMANLFLHHFNNEALRELFAEAAEKVSAFFACEPRRSRLSLAAIRLLPLIGCNAVTRHDAAASIRAGFLGKELSALWPESTVWKGCEFEGGFASHCFKASR